jgi:superfamily II DNA helicase RecQ
VIDECHMILESTDQ